MIFNIIIKTDKESEWSLGDRIYTSYLLAIDSKTELNSCDPSSVKYLNHFCFSTGTFLQDKVPLSAAPFLELAAENQTIASLQVAGRRAAVENFCQCFCPTAGSRLPTRKFGRLQASCSSWAESRSQAEVRQWKYSKFPSARLTGVITVGNKSTF